VSADGRSGRTCDHPELRELNQELAALAAQVQDAGVRERILLLRTRLPTSAPEMSRPRVALTPREVDVVTQVALGRSNREAAQQLGLLTTTVKSYLRTAMHKLEAHNRVQAVIAAREADVIP
jgi:DNA-binding NarL/FixJ family response regulator